MEMSNKWNMFEKLCDLQILSDRSCANALSDPTGISTLTLWSLQWCVCSHLSWGREGWAGEQPHAFSELYPAHSLAVSKCILFATWSVPWWGAFKYSCVYIHVYSQKKQVQASLMNGGLWFLGEVEKSILCLLKEDWVINHLEIGSWQQSWLWSWCKCTEKASMVYHYVLVF